MLRLGSSLLLLLLLGAGSHTVTTAQTWVAEIMQVGGFVDTAFCYQAILDADQNSNDRITDQEYVSLAQTLSPPGLIDDVTRFDQLPFAFTSTFRNLACLCQIPSFGGDANDEFCCAGRNAHIRVPEDPESPTVDATDVAYLYAVCALTEGAAESILDSPFPTANPTRQPTVSPSSVPTASPSVVPTVSPTASPSSVPTIAPSETPSHIPTAQPQARVAYQIAVRDGVALTEDDASFEASYLSDLLAAMDGLALQVQVPGVQVIMPTRIETPETIDCPAELTNEGDLCQTITAIVPLETDDDVDRIPRYETELFSAIFDGELQAELDKVRPDTPVLILTGATPPPVTPAPTAPTVAPTLAPTGTPTVSPTLAPTIPPSLTPTASPTTTPTLRPTREAERVSATVEYEIAVTNGLAQQDNPDFEALYLSDLQVAMDGLALDIGGEDEFSGVARRRRKLASSLQVLLPSTFGEIQDFDCPEGLTEDGDLCQTITAIIPLAVSTDPDTTAPQFASLFASEVFNAVFNGDLQTELDEVRSDSPVIVLTGLPPVSNGTRDVSSDELSTGARAGIVIGACVVALVAAALFIARRKRPEAESKREYAEYHGEDDSGDAAPKDSSAHSDSIYTDGALQLSDAGGATTLGASNPDYGKKHSRKALEVMEAGEDLVAEPEHDQYESSSNAGSSGWSSSAGISSLNTGSMDDSMDAAVAAGATLASMGLASGLRSARASDPSSSLQSGGSEDMAGMPQASREQLDNLIEAGDWAAVGATAALLAAASDSQSFSSKSRGTARSVDSGSVDAARAAELDHLVDAGDWEGVVLAAAKYQTAESDQKSPTAGASLDSSVDSRSGTGTGTAGSPSVSTSLSDSPSKAAKHAEVRSEVEALVRRVVPEEIDNVDEMMNQFKGREDELVETLRTMQERAVAQKARAAGHKAAKAKAKQSVQRGVVPGAEAAAQRAAMQQTTSPTKSMGEQSADSSTREQRTALEDAIEAGDWEAVGQAAALISDRSVDTASTGSMGDLRRDRNQLAAEDASRASEVDVLVDVGDWTGVIQAAKRFKQEETTETEEDKAAKMSQEEEEALKQAEVWMRIAEQKKAEGATDVGASDAAEWAIQRSLSQLREADRKKPPADDDQEV